jgi:protein phosphatase
MAVKPEEEAPRLRVNWCGRTVTGRVRRNNEDTLWAAPLGAPEAREGDSEGEADTPFPGLLFAVADGMGGALAGEVASGLAVSTLGSEMARRVRGITEGNEPPERHAEMLRSAVEAANACIRGEGENNPQRTGMGTTLTAVWILGETAEIAQVGDSRAYLFRDGHLKQLTKDQSLVGKLIEDGIITEEEAERMAGRNIILQALGTEEPLEVVHEQMRLEGGDMLLLCTDGLSGVVNNRDLEEELRKGGTSQEICARLTDLANGRGGPDNITVLLARTDDVP